MSSGAHRANEFPYPVGIFAMRSDLSNLREWKSSREDRGTLLVVNDDVENGSFKVILGPFRWTHFPSQGPDVIRGKWTDYCVHRFGKVLRTMDSAIRVRVSQLVVRWGRGRGCARWGRLPGARAPLTRVR